MMKTLVVVGGSGFVGRHFLKVIGDLSEYQVVFAIHRTEPEWLASAPVQRVNFDIDDSASLRKVLPEGCTVINLLRPDGSGWFEAGIRNVLHACANARVKRYIHVSSIDVFGAAEEAVVSASTPIKPRTPYELEHAAAEALVKEVKSAVMEVVVLRLGAVFGEGGLNIVSFVEEVHGAPLWKLALRRLLYGKRRMHLVSVGKVVRTLAFFVTLPTVTQGAVVLVTDDASPENNFAYLQDEMMRAFQRSTISYVPHVPLALLGFLLKMRGISNSNPMRRFDEPRLEKWGQHTVCDFKQQLHSYIECLRKSR